MQGRRSPRSGHTDDATPRRSKPQPQSARRAQVRSDDPDQSPRAFARPARAKPASPRQPASSLVRDAYRETDAYSASPITRLGSPVDIIPSSPRPLAPYL